MAERARKRMAAARVSVSFAVAGLLAGWATTEGLPGAIASRLSKTTTVPPNSVSSRQVANHSLLYKDFKQGEVYSQAQANKIYANLLTSKDAARTYLKKVHAANTYLQKADAANTYLKKADAANTYLKKADAANTYLKKADAQREFVGGSGNMFVGAQHDAGGAVQLLVVPGLVTLAGNNDPAGAPPSITITNTSGSPLSYATPTNSGIIAVRGSLTVTLQGNAPSQTIQIFSVDGGTVATANVSAISGTGGVVDFAAQLFSGGV